MGFRLLYWVILVYIGLCLGYVGIMENKMETTIMGLGFRTQGLGI